nr:immunoglobulin heavy chain junction region [Mus musculus]
CASPDYYGSSHYAMDYW